MRCIIVSLEYWITNDDPKYNTLMQGVSEFIKSPNDKDVKVSDVFTEVYLRHIHFASASLIRVPFADYVCRIEDPHVERWLDGY